MSFVLVVPGSIEFHHPWYSFCPFYDTQGYPIPVFESSGLSLAYGDPKGRAYIESLERFFAVVMQGQTGGGGDDADAAKQSFLAAHIERLVESLSMGGHPYVK